MSCCFRELLFSSRAEELAVLRELSDALVRNLFSKPLLGQEVNCCALNEIIALKGKKVQNHISIETECSIILSPFRFLLKVGVL